MARLARAARVQSYGIAAYVGIGDFLGRLMKRKSWRMMNRWLLAALAAALAARVGMFVRDSGELSSLSNHLAHTGRCKKLQPHLRGFEDLAVFDGGEMVALSSDHSHFAFKFGAASPHCAAHMSAPLTYPPPAARAGGTMREALVQRLRHSGGISPVRAVAIRADGTVHDVELRGRPQDFFPHGIAASPTRLGGGVLLVVRAPPERKAIRSLGIW